MSRSPDLDRTTVVDWNRLDEGSLPDPLVRSVPYVELLLEHPALEATALGQSFFPAAVPYELDGQRRVFYWQSSLPTTPPPPPPADWTGVCATADALRAVTHGDAVEPKLVEEVPDAAAGEDSAEPCKTDEPGEGHEPGVGGDGHVREVVVDGTVAGDSTTAVVADYVPPSVEVRHVTPDAVEVAIAGDVELVRAGERRRFELPSQSVRTVESGEMVSTTPELVVRFPGRRVLYHPAPDADYRLFPSFGLDVDSLSRPASVPTHSGELDYRALAERFGVALSERPYAERVLWQAFAFAAFDPHATTSPAIGQFESGEIAVQATRDRTKPG